MGTRGFVGFVVDGKEKIAYNHFDSYPGGLGADVLKWLRMEIEIAYDELEAAKTNNWPADALDDNAALERVEKEAATEAPTRAVTKLREQVRNLRVVDPESKPTEADIERLKHFADTDVSTRSLEEWYVLLRGTQGNPVAMLQAGVIEDASEFPSDSLFAEWGYVVDLDNEAFEVYQGFRREPHNKGRFADRPVEPSGLHGDTYYPVALVGVWAFSALPTDEEFAQWGEVVED